MTIVSSSPQEDNRNKSRLPDEKSPLLPIDNQDSYYEEFNGASFTGAVFNLSTTIVGAGIMSLPATMKVLGLVLGVLFIILTAFLTEQSIQFLLRLTAFSSYGALMGNAFGTIGKTFLEVTIIVNNAGYLIVYMIIIGDVLSGTSSSGVLHSGILEQWFGVCWWTSRNAVLLFATLAIFFPLACFKRIDSLRYTSAVSVGLAVSFLVITIGITVVKLVNGSIMMPRMLPAVSDLSSIVHLFTSVPILVTVYLCQSNVHSIQNELEEPSQMINVARTSLTLCASVYITTGVFGYLLFGEGTLDDFLANFDSDLGIPFSNVLSAAVRISYAAHLMLVYPIVLYPLRASIDALLFPSSPPLLQSNARFAAVTVGVIAMIYIGGCFIPSIWDAFQFIGATTVVCLGFIFPAAIALRDVDGMATRKDKILSVSMIVLAVLSNLVAVYSDAAALISN